MSSFGIASNEEGLYRKHPGKLFIFAVDAFWQVLHVDKISFVVRHSVTFPARDLGI